MSAIYVWGSVTRSDFDPETSDIDVLCIVEEEFPKELNEVIREELSKIAPEYEWGFQIVYLSELNGGPVRSRLASAMHVASILPLFPQWIHVAGRRFSRSDFTLVDAPIDERIKENAVEIQRRYENQLTADEYRKLRDRKGIVKACLLIIYNKQVGRAGYFDLDYNVLPARATSQEKEMLDILLLTKKGNLYDSLEFDQAIDKILKFSNSAIIEV